ncbi:23S ribosomal RNA methyltransferase Erm [Salicibibacter cibi]|uniref:rRNA adenine N-6-methyltransferase n=1 Tax=Salicibibacter cibi TaxID=2743001 RepID=A0A7T6Z9K9_9BACI|nr:23S ribosomal RNA methyltransferase Erm [Salicibibacter cibi]QQK79456.1 23S ribosomal RNA methyltransferase Erm [Salicibibacter cibi]
MTKKIHKYNDKKLSRGEPPNFSGQHFMHNKKLLHDIVQRANVNKRDTVLELGAGKGALTTILAQSAGKVLAVEFDGKLVDTLEWKTAPNTTVIHQDMMEIRLPEEKFVVVSNIPYSITTPIMKMLLDNPSSGLQKGIIIMEKGAAKRFTAKPVKNSYVLAWRMWFDIRYVKGISRNNFSPPPKVDSALVLITRRKEPIVQAKDYAAFLGLAQYAFKQPGATIGNALKGVFTPPQLKHLRKELDVTNEIPIGSLTDIQWGIVFNTMTQYVQQPLWPRAKRNK